MALNREAVIRAAEKYVSKGKLEAAIKEYRKVLAENPNDANTLNRVGDLYARTERFGEAVKLFTQIAEQYTRDGFFVKAIAIYKKIIKLDPTSLPVYERLAELYFKQGLLNEARTQYQVLADYYQKHDNATSAITIYQKMSEMEPDNPSFHLKLAELFASQRLTDKALRSYRKLADLLIVNGSVDEASQVYLKAFELGGDQGDFVREAVMGLHDGGYVGAAARVLSGAAEHFPEAATLAAEIGLVEESEESSDAESFDFGEPELEDAAPVEEASFAAEAEMSPGAEAEATFDLEPFSPDVSFGDEESLPVELDETDSAYVLPDVSFADAEEAVAELADFTAGTEEPVEAPGGWAMDDSGTAGVGASFQDTGSFAPPSLAGEGDEAVGVFTFDLEDDEVPDTLVAPPADMLEGEEEPGVALSEGSDDFAGGEPGGGLSGFDQEVDEEDVIELDLDGSLDLGALDLEPLADTVGGETPLAGDEPEEMTLDLEVQDLDLESEDVALEEEPAFALEDDEPVAEAPSTVDQDEGPVADRDAADTAGPPSVRREEDLLAEARVFAKYGLEEKALDRLDELIEMSPDHLDGLELRTRIHLEAKREEKVISGANEVARVALESGRLEVWNELKADLAKAGYSGDDGRVAFQPGEKPAEDDRIAQLLEDLSLEDFGLPSSGSAGRSIESADVAGPAWSEGAGALEAAGEMAAEAPAVEAPEALAEASPLEPALVQPSSEEAPPSGAAEKKPPGKISLIDQLDLGDLQDGADEGLGEEEIALSDAVALEEGVGGEPVSLDEMLDETGMSWLDDVGDGDAVPADPAAALFDEEDDFFDLAAELERELTEDELEVGRPIQPQEQSLEEIIEGFKRGVAENLSPEDYETHYNLGIAYREMGLLDEAIGEFQLAAKDERYTVDCSSLLGSCFLEKGLPELAVRWYRKGLESPAINDEATAGLLYDMGNAYLSLGDSEAAYKTFVEVYGLDSGYRDVSEKLEALKSPDPAV